MTSEELAYRIRRDAIEMVHKSHASHIGSILSAADIIAVLYTDIMNVDPTDPNKTDRDRFVLSKGHAGVAVYAALAEQGFFSTEVLRDYYGDGGTLSGHVSHFGVPGVELSTGSLGHGVAVACGMALAAKQREKPYHVYVVVGDGECNEGIVWETALIAKQFQLNNFTVIVDHNKMQAMGFCKEIINMEPMEEKWRSFGWNVISVQDGNDHDQLRVAFARTAPCTPTCIIANTIKGKGVSFMENELLWHYRDPQGELYEQAVLELKGKNYEESDH